MRLIMPTMRLITSLLAAVAVQGALGHVGRGLSGHLPSDEVTVGNAKVQARAGDAHLVHSAKFGRRQQQYNDATWQSVTDPATECNGYWDPTVSNLANNYPSPWTIAQILPSDTEAQAIWNKIQSSGIIPPGIQPKGTPDGDRTGVNYNAQEDPDCDWTAAKCTTPKHPGIPPDITACDEPHTWGLSFDDGPNCTHNAFYDFLKENNQKATLFYIGSNVINWPLQAQRGLTDGHVINVHTMSHHYMTALTDEQVFAELYYTIKAIKDIVGVTCTRWRPPYGDVDDRVRAIATGLGLATVLWSDDTSDWSILPQGTQPTATIDANYASIIAKATSPALSTSGILVLTHEIDNATMFEAMSQYPNIKAAFKNVAPIEICMNTTNPYYETSIVYPTFQQYTSGTVMAEGLPSAESIQAAAALFTPRNFTGGTSNRTIGSMIAASKSHGSNTTSASGSSSARPSVSAGSLVSNKHSGADQLQPLLFAAAVVAATAAVFASL